MSRYPFRAVARQPRGGPFRLNHWSLRNNARLTDFGVPSSKRYVRVSEPSRLRPLSFAGRSTEPGSPRAAFPQTFFVTGLTPAVPILRGDVDRDLSESLPLRGRSVKRKEGLRIKRKVLHGPQTPFKESNGTSAMEGQLHVRLVAGGGGAQRRLRSGPTDTPESTIHACPTEENGRRAMTTNRPHRSTTKEPTFSLEGHEASWTRCRASSTSFPQSQTVSISRTPCPTYRPRPCRPP